MNDKISLAVFECNREGQFEVHAAGCADCAKTKKRTGLNFTVAQYATALDVSRDIWYDMIHEGSMTPEGGLSEIIFKPCVKFSS